MENTADLSTMQPGVATEQGPGQIEEIRSRNLRQLLLRASRIVNRHVVDGLRDRGHIELRSTHTTLLSNMQLSGGTVTEIAERAGVTKQAMGRLADDLEKAGYIRSAADPNDARSRRLILTDQGRDLMFDSFEVMADLERRYSELLGSARMTALIGGLQVFIESAGR